MPSNHAILAPSASSRWMKCAPSARLEAQTPEKDTPYSIEGTIAHAMAESLLRKALAEQWRSWPEDFASLFRAAWNEYQERVDSVPAPNLETLYQEVQQALDHGFDPWEMLATVSDYYCKFVYEDYLTVHAKDPEAQLLVEQELKLGEFIPEGFGSSDAVLLCGKWLCVYDLKYGKGVKVDAAWNTQMMCYALGALCGPAELYDIETVRMTIIQPRLRWVSQWDLLAADIWEWAKAELRPAAVTAYQGLGKFVPGSHCRFCKVAPRCKALASYATAINSAPCGDAGLMTDAEIADALRDAVTLKSWLASLEAYALEKALEGREFPGFKVVEGRSVRQISDPQAAMDELANAGFDEDYYLKPKELQTITNLEKLLGKKGFQSLLGKYVIKPQGKPTLVEDDDPRPVFNSAQSAINDFKDV